jgi:hypothetical protein
MMSRQGQGTIEDDSESALLIVGEEIHARAAEVRIVQVGACYQ